MSLATEQMSQFGELCGPGQFLQNAPQKHESDDVGDRRQDGWNLRAQVGHPAEDVWIAAQLIEEATSGWSVAEIE